MSLKQSVEKCLTEFAAANPIVAQQTLALNDLYRNKQMHELSNKLIEYVSLQFFQEGNTLQKLYDQFISKLITTIDPLIYAQTIVIIAKSYIKPEDAIVFLDSIEISNIEAKLYLQVGKGYYYLKQEAKELLRELINSSEKCLKTNSNIDALVHSYLYQLCALYYAKMKDFDNFYKYGLQYLAYTPEKLMSTEEKVRWSYDMGIAVLLGPNIYNISELLEKDVLKVLPQTQHKWLSDLLFTLNGGRITEFNNVLKVHSEIIGKQEQIMANMKGLSLKIRILQLIELIFLREKGSRNITFNAIAQALEIEMKEVEWILMKAMSLKLIKGEIDEIEGVARITWVLPRYLDKQRIAVMQSKFQGWREKTTKVMKDYEQMKANIVVPS